MARIGFEWQRTDEPKSASDPDNLFHPLEGDARVGGDFTYQTMPKSIWTWWERHPAAGNLLAGAALAALAVTAARRLANGDGGSAEGSAPSPASSASAGLTDAT